MYDQTITIVGHSSCPEFLTRVAFLFASQFHCGVTEPSVPRIDVYRSDFGNKYSIYRRGAKIYAYVILKVNTRAAQNQSHDGRVPCQYQSVS